MVTIFALGVSRCRRDVRGESVLQFRQACMMESGWPTLYQRASAASRDGVRRFWQWSWSIRVCWIGAGLLILGTLGPWETYGTSGIAGPYGYHPGLDFSSGTLAIGLGILTGFVLSAIMHGHRSSSSPAIAGLGLVAVGVIAARFVETARADEIPGGGGGFGVSPGWGLYVCAAGALALLLAGAYLFIGDTQTGRASSGAARTRGRPPLA